MQCIILAAGKGTRMRPLTLETPKPMIEIIGKPLLHHIIDSLPEEITELILVVGYKQAQIKAYFGKEFEGKKITYVVQKESRGTGHALSLCKDLIKPDEKFLLLVGDDIHSPKALKRLVGHSLALLVHQHPEPSRFGVIEIDKNNKAISFIEKPTHPKSNLVWPGVAVLDKRVFNYELPLHELGEYFATDQINNFMKEFDFVVEQSELWHPIGYPHEINKAEEILSKGKNIKNPYSDTLLVILAGGKGTRMPKDEQDKPKVMVDISGKPLLQHQIEIAKKQGFSNIRLSLGYGANYIINWLKQNKYKIDYVVEEKPLGTGGAIKLATKEEKNPFIAINGDDIADIDYKDLIRHSSKGKYNVVAGLEATETSEWGLLEYDKDKKIYNFKEKQPNAGKGIINIGHYYLKPEIFKNTPDSFSIEKNLFPKLSKEGKLVLMEHKGGYWFGCGTPEILQKTRDYFAKNSK